MKEYFGHNRKKKKKYMNIQLKNCLMKFVMMWKVLSVGHSK